jgi:hypothetical protein
LSYSRLSPHGLSSSSTTTTLCSYCSMASLQEHSSSATANGDLRKSPNHKVAETELSYKVGDSVGGGESI